MNESIEHRPDHGRKNESYRRRDQHDDESHNAFYCMRPVKTQEKSDLRT